MAKSITLEQGLDLFIQSRRSNSTKRTQYNYIYHLTRFFKFLKEQHAITKVDEVTVDAIHDFIGCLRESRVSTWSRETHIRNPNTYRSFVDYLVKNEIQTGQVDNDVVRGYIRSLAQTTIPPYYIHNPSHFVGAFLRFVAFLNEKALQPHQVDDEILNAYIEFINHRKFSQSYVHNHARDIRAFLNYMRKEHYLRKDLEFVMPVVKHKNRHKLTKEESQQVYAACKSLREKLLVALALDTGLRLTEIANLNWENIHLKRNLIEVISGKGEKDRIVGFSDAVGLLLKKWQIESIDSESQPQGAVFRTANGERLLARGISSVFYRLSKRSGIQVSSHALRRTCAHNLDKAGMQLSKIQQQLGHENITTTRDYIGELDDEDIAQRIRESSVVGEIIREADRKGKTKKNWGKR
jgi:integrase/recombinase XerD